MEKNDEVFAEKLKAGAKASASSSMTEKKNLMNDQNSDFSFTPVNESEKSKFKMNQDRENEPAGEFDSDFLIRNRDLLLQLQEQQRRERFLKNVQSQLCFTPKQQFKIVNPNSQLIATEEMESFAFNKTNEVRNSKESQEQRYTSFNPSSTIPGLIISKFPFKFTSRKDVLSHFEVNSLSFLFVKKREGREDEWRIQIEKRKNRVSGIL
jgi:hypothetical protein